METLILGCLAASLIIFLISACIQCIGIEKDIIDLTDMADQRVNKLYKGK
jgi:hypothetical protein